MKYLRYYTDGYFRKFPLEKDTITIGRNRSCDLVIKDGLVSNQHLKVDVKEDFIIIIDLGSTNGTYVKDGKVKEAVIKMGESFNIGGSKFVLQEGDLEEFKAAKELIPFIDKIEKDSVQTVRYRGTRYEKNIYKELSKQILKIGLNADNINDFVLDLSNYLSSIPDFGNLFIVSRHNEKTNVLLAIDRAPGMMDLVNRVLEGYQGIFKKKLLFRPVPNEKYRFYSYPVNLNTPGAALIYFPRDSQQREHAKIEQFLLILSKAISLVSQMLDDHYTSTETVVHRLKTPVDIIGESESMKDLIRMAKELAASKLSILIKGESGTGKELFARLIHKYSKQKNKNFVAINCASFPESLQEAEFFGYERGAFTGAYQRRRGKLELATGGTLVLDEIGDMGLPLQANLLRALQEQEFYRLGGLETVKVDLRVISLTNKNLDDLLKKGLFREDLYYRLVHRTLTIPPLRDRKEDIPLLINFFTQKFCREIDKCIGGYSGEALEALKKFSWPGNVRQLENEIQGVVNLTNEGERAEFDTLSDEVKFNKEHWNHLKTSAAADKENMVENNPEVAEIITALKKHRWNKTRAAKELGMTYEGLHKKMKRLGIKRTG
jgi:DNA-binding NtrC family response regulator/pSer/pThr/pTyr-binding forkhead associated (FHA) protein